MFEKRRAGSRPVIGLYAIGQSARLLTLLFRRSDTMGDKSPKKENKKKPKADKKAKGEKAR